MILGIGTDIVEIKRIKHAIARWGDRFVNRLFSRREIEYCYSKSEPST
ncbi:MAG: 4'-phosphopantetheinyl transferase superfamily protein, partial [Nitrospiraceae bacterium]|nr:4'-phosphopantetheinyl transferase superfamily protein [Nitrospiraceae bacterium]